MLISHHFLQQVKLSSNPPSIFFYSFSPVLSSHQHLLSKGLPSVVHSLVRWPEAHSVPDFISTEMTNSWSLPVECSLVGKSHGGEQWWGHEKDPSPFPESLRAGFAGEGKAKEELDREEGTEMRILKCCEWETDREITWTAPQLLDKSRCGSSEHCRHHRAQEAKRPTGRVCYSCVCARQCLQPLVLLIWACSFWAVSSLSPSHLRGWLAFCLAVMTHLPSLRTKFGNENLC